MHTKTSNDQSARVYRQKGITMMVPFLRGRGGNPGNVEGFFGEVDDVISSLDFLAKQKHVDPKRIYLGGHSSGGTLAVLVAAATDRFAGIFCFGPTDDDYGKKNAPYDWTQKERELRQPIKHLASIQTPTYVIEGTQGSYYVQKVSKTILLNDLKQLFDARDSVQYFADRYDPCYDGWEVELPK